MPYQESPPQRIPLYSPLANRGVDLLKDSRLYNGYVEKGKEEGEAWIYKRPGYSKSGQVGAPGDAGRGVFNWNGTIYAVYQGTLYQNGAAVGTVNNAGVYTFSSCLGATPRLFLKNETFAYTYDPASTVLAQVVDPDYPSATVPGCVYLDGTMYILTPEAHVQGSDINDPSAWDPLNFLLAQIEPDAGVALAKQLVYVIALKSISTEVFYDQGNGSGSPLGPVQGSKLGVGCRAAGTVARSGDDLLWIGTTTEGDVQVMLMRKVSGEAISTPAVERLLQPLNYNTAWSWTAKVAGHRFYVVTLPFSNLTLAFDISAGGWYIWTDTNGNYLPIVSATHDSAGNILLQHATDGALYLLSDTIFTDAGSPIATTVYTAPVDGGLRLAKTCRKAELVGDILPTSVDISWSDDDYQTFTSPQTISLNQDRPWIDDGSTFARRAYKITHTEAKFFRLKALDLTILTGSA